MTFASIDFAIFFIIVLSLYFFIQKKYQNPLLLIASYIFYGWWDWRFLSLILFSTFTDYIIAKKIFKNEGHTKKKYLITSVCINLALLGFFKYFNFFIESMAETLSAIGIKSNSYSLNIILPLGISFYTFQTMAYTIDIYRGRIKPLNNAIDFGLYVTYFPQLVAGPIERAQNLIPQLLKPRDFDLENFKSGFLLVLIGLVRKIVIADTAAIYVQNAFQDTNELNSIQVLQVGILFSLQIYGDFAGYTDIARGVSRILGIELMQNFNAPYFAKNITEFWHRWHISLSTWLRDYLYIPLGGNRGSSIFYYRNIALTMVLGGLWHGASWKFVIWGGLHAIALIMHKMWVKNQSKKDSSRSRIILESISAWCLTMAIVMFAWLFFAAPTSQSAFQLTHRLFSFNGNITDLDFVIIFPLISLMLIIDIPQQLFKNHTAFIKWPPLIQSFIYTIFILLILMYGGKTSEPFIYFQF